MSSTRVMESRALDHYYGEIVGGGHVRRPLVDPPLFAASRLSHVHVFNDAARFRPCLFLLSMLIKHRLLS